MKDLCPSCGSRYDSLYCPHCGRRRGPTCLSWDTLRDGAMPTLAGNGLSGELGQTLHYGVLGTLRQTLDHPVRTTREFLAGKRRKFFSPTALPVLLSGVCALVNTLFSLKFIELSPDTSQNTFFTFNYLKGAIDYANTHPATFMLTGISFMALACKWIFRPRILRCIEFPHAGIFTSVIAIILLPVESLIPGLHESRAASSAHNLPVFCVETAIYHKLFGRNIFRTGLNSSVKLYYRPAPDAPCNHAADLLRRNCIRDRDFAINTR